MNRALFEKNAAACESAKHPVCTCACGGALHGVAHSREWLEATWARIDAEQKRELENRPATVAARRELERVEQLRAL